MLRSSLLLMASVMHHEMTVATADVSADRPDGTVLGRAPPPYNMYKDPNINEARRMYPVVRDMRGRVAGLLDEWPGHPTLEQLLRILDRILSFPLTSPLMMVRRVAWRGRRLTQNCNQLLN
jgi:midasin